MDQRIALVTGASRGIGRAAAKALAKAGAHVILVSRTVGALEEVDDEIRKDGGAATLVPLDIRDFPALDRLGATIFERWGRLDAFLGNAGSLGVITPLAHLEPKAFQELIEVNVTANWRLIRSFDPLLRRSDAGRALFVTSGAARKHTPFWGGYAMAKAALESLALTYAAECSGTNVKVNLLEPGSDTHRDARQARRCQARTPTRCPSRRRGRSADRGAALARVRQDRRDRRAHAMISRDIEARKLVHIFLERDETDARIGAARQRFAAHQLPRQHDRGHARHLRATYAITRDQDQHQLSQAAAARGSRACRHRQAAEVVEPVAHPQQCRGMAWQVERQAEAHQPRHRPGAEMQDAELAAGEEAHRS